MQTGLSEKTQTLVEKLFPQSDRQRVANLLKNECGNNLPLLETYNLVQLERFQFAALKLSAGNLGKLEQQIRIAKSDWRDLLVSAGFGNDVEAHNKWGSVAIRPNLIKCRYEITAQTN